MSSKETGPQPDKSKPKAAPSPEKLAFERLLNSRGHHDPADYEYPDEIDPISFTDEEMKAGLDVRMRTVQRKVQTGELSDITLGEKRLLFGKWLVEHDRVSDDFSGVKK